ncbi:hypothetical protein [Streptomyces sp. NPDC059639]|uniref:hypothetical protein n=1 Tax=Streptomyces sp. NPDC059639 TaxID=3346891 RepID=UPI003679EC54
MVPLRGQKIVDAEGGDPGALLLGGVAVPLRPRVFAGDVLDGGEEGDEAGAFAVRAVALGPCLFGAGV